VVHDIVIDTLFEEDLARGLEVLHAGRLVMDKDDPEEPFLTPEEGYLIVRIKDQDPVAFSRELEKRVSQMRIVTVVDRPVRSAA
jgi:hypothetical protein